MLTVALSYSQSLLINELDTFGVIPISDIRRANIKLIEREYLLADVSVYKDIVSSYISLTDTLQYKLLITNNIILSKDSILNIEKNISIFYKQECTYWYKSTKKWKTIAIIVGFLSIGSLII